MIFSEKDLRHIAQLVRLELTNTEIKQYRTELGGILRYVDQLQSLTLKKIVSKVDDNISLSLRHDQVAIWPETETEIALNQAPYKKDKQIKVQRILD